MCVWPAVRQVYLIWVSFRNLRKTYDQAKVEARGESAQKRHAEAMHAQLDHGTLTTRVLHTRGFAPPPGAAPRAVYATVVAVGAQVPHHSFL